MDERKLPGLNSFVNASLQDKAKTRRQMTITVGILLILARFCSLRALHFGLLSKAQTDIIAIGGCLILVIFSLVVVRDNIKAARK